MSCFPKIKRLSRFLRKAGEALRLRGAEGGLFHPVALAENEDEEKGADEPCDRVCSEDHGDIRDKVDHEGDIGDPEQTPDAQHDAHGDDSAARATENGGGSVGECHQAVEEGDHPGLPDAESHHLGGGAEQTDKRGGQEEDGQAYQLGKAHREQKAGLGALLDPVILACSQVLTYKGGDGQGKAHDGEKAEALHLGVASATGHGGVTKGVDIGLDHQVGDGDDAVLYPTGKPHAEDLLQDGQVGAQLFQGEADHEFAAHQMGEAQDGAEGLANDGGGGGALDAPVKDGHEQKVQNHVDKRGEDEVIEGMAAVPQGLEDAVHSIVKYQGEQAGAVDSKVGNGVGKDVFRGAHPAENGRGEADAQDGQEDSRSQGKDHGGVDRLVHAILVPGPIVAGDDDAGPDEGALEEAHDKVTETAGRADGGQRVIAAEVAHHQGVHGVVHLLKEVSQKKGKGKPKQDLPDGSFGHQCFWLTHGLNGGLLICFPKGENSLLYISIDLKNLSVKQKRS